MNNEKTSIFYDEECSICYEIIENKNKCITDCKHVFHLKCILLLIKNNELKCPLCRNDIIKQEQYKNPIRNRNRLLLEENIEYLNSLYFVTQNQNSIENNTENNTIYNNNINNFFIRIRNIFY